MGTSATPAELGGKFTKAANNLATAQRIGVANAALMAKETLQVAPVPRGLPPTGLRGRGYYKKPIPWGVRYDVKGSLNATALVRMWGMPVYLWERGSYKHPAGWAITPRKAGGSRASRAARVASGQGLKNGKAALKLPEGYAPFVKNHPPFKARPFFQPAKAAIVKAVPKTTAATYRRALIQSF